MSLTFKFFFFEAVKTRCGYFSGLIQSLIKSTFLVIVIMLTGIRENIDLFCDHNL